MSGQIITVESLVQEFRAGKADPVRALDGLSFNVNQGEVFGFLGPNGAGKTTSVRILNGVLAPTSGRISVMGLDPANQGCDLRRQTGVLTETPSLYERLTARDNLKIFGTLYGIPEDRLQARVSELIEQFGLRDRADSKVGGFSKGMKQRLALARALIHDPQLIFLDEPTSGLDPEASLQVTRWIEQLSHQKGRTIFLCTHNLDEAQRLCDRVAVINRGRLLACGTQSELAGLLWRGSWVDFYFEEALQPETIDRLTRLPGVIKLQPDSSQAAIQVDSLSSIPDMIAQLVAGGARILQVTPRQHTLEDIYFEIQSGSKAGPEKEH
jgi:ABC-2 type transport system ATP-binding protein